MNAIRRAWLEPSFERARMRGRVHTAELPRMYIVEYIYMENMQWAGTARPSLVRIHSRASSMSCETGESIIIRQDQTVLSGILPIPPRIAGLCLRDLDATVGLAVRHSQPVHPRRWASSQ